MIQHGAQDIFENGGSTILNDDIEAVLQRSEEKTQELEQKYKDMGFDELQKFTVGQGTGESLYNWEGENFKNKRKSTMAGLKWIQPAKRERKTNYAIDKYYRETLGMATRGPTKAAPKPHKFENMYVASF